MTDRNTREIALRDLLELRAPVREAIARLAEFPWDSEEELVELSRSNVSRALDLFQRDALSVEELTEWPRRCTLGMTLGWKPITSSSSIGRCFT